MKKEKTVKTYQRRTKTGKVVTVRQHTAKYDAADKAAEVSKKKGSGDELESLKKSKQVDTPMEISKDDFKEWYNFNEWDTPKKEWPDAVKKVDSHLRKTMGKKGYDDYCAKIDESWSARGHLKAYKDFSASSSSSPATAKVAKAKVDSKQVKDTNYTSNGSYYNSKLNPEEFMDKFFKLHSSGKYTEAAKMLDSTLGKGAWDALNKKAPSFDFDSTKDRNEKFMGLVEEQVGEHHWSSQQGKSKSSSSSTKFESSINEVLNNAGFKNDVSSIKVDGDSVKIRLEGKAYGDGYSSYVRYNPTRPKDGYESEGNPKRAGRIYEALRKLKGIDKIKSLVITESYD